MHRMAPQSARIFLRWSHFVAGVTWIGLLYFFNLVNVPVQKGLDAETKKKVNPDLLGPCALVVSLGRGSHRARWSDLLRDVHPQAGRNQCQCHRRRQRINIWYVLIMWLLYPVVLFVIEFLIIKKVPALTKTVACLRLSCSYWWRSLRRDW